ncbi:unnamed protein product [Candidula unifasciata]|uniref:G-protein coupled receptors family 1 profile domain-containing protein n=1 Tax=Candidula unifasciata TaxID=100452 RepID=A0A8S3ZQY4_9EUPU|nr:unnamed protein product [Candidula unifasciata]
MAGINCINCTYGGVLPHPVALVDDSVKDIISDVSFIGAGSVISLFGIITNILNIVVYLKQGIKDSATVQFLSLSTSDCLFSVLVFMSSLGVLVSRIETFRTILDPVSFTYSIVPVREKAYSVSISIIVLMSLERCFCVAYPFTVKLIFTKSRSILIIICIAAIFVASLIPEYLTKGLAWTYDKRSNRSRLTYWSSTAASDVLKNSILAGVLPVVSGVGTTFCTLYMISAIKASNKFRQSTAPSVRKCSDASTKENKTASKRVTSKETKTNKQTKDARITRTVIVVNIIFILCNLPKCSVFSSSVARMYIPDFSLFTEGKYQNIVAILMTFTFVFEAINGASTFMVYYTFNASFKATVGHILCSYLNDK